jgi:REP element-mobilizing transposase RayT
MVAGHHLLWTAYGWWLPNDPRGSMSHHIASASIAELGTLHYGRKRIQPASRDLKKFYEQAREVLKHELLTLTPEDFELIAEAFATVIKDQHYTCYACAIMPDHVHLLIRKHRDDAEEMIEKFQAASREALIQSGRREASHPVWGGQGWKVFMNPREDFRRTVRYIENNPLKAHMPAQKWPFVVEYDGWLPGLGTKSVAKPQAGHRTVRNGGRRR